MFNFPASRWLLKWAPQLSASALLVASQASFAALSENLTIANPKALALGNAVTADPPGIDSIHFNPAGLARVHGREGLFKLTLAYFNLQADFGSYSDRAQSEIDKWALGETDPVENSHSETDTIMLKVPFVDGRQEWPLPMMVVPTGGAAFRPEGSWVPRPLLLWRRVTCVMMMIPVALWVRRWRLLVLPIFPRQLALS